VVSKMNGVLAHCVCRPLIPRRVGERLLRRQHLDEPSREMIEFIRLRNVPVERRRVELREQVNPAQSGVDAIGNRNVHQTIFSCQGNRGFGPFFGEREQTRALPPPMITESTLLVLIDCRPVCDPVTFGCSASLCILDGFIRLSARIASSFRRRAIGGSVRLLPLGFLPPLHSWLF